MSDIRRFFYDCEFIEQPGTIELISIGVVSDDGRRYYAVSNQWDANKANDWLKANVLLKLPHSDTWKSRSAIASELIAFIEPWRGRVEMWGYYADYDHVALCWLFGRMIDLPKGMPMYTRDIKQWCDALGNPQLPKCHNEHDALNDAMWNKQAYEFLATYAADELTRLRAENQQQADELERLRGIVGKLGGEIKAGVIADMIAAQNGPPVRLAEAARGNTENRQGDCNV